jgi:ABC-type long-subunit fatty acid transport system fused permease/ATPase subunit
MTIIHSQVFEQAEKIIRADGDNLQANMRSFLLNLFHMPEMIFFTRYYHDIEELLSSIESHKEQSNNRVQGILENLLIMAGINVKKVKSGVVSNYLHAMYLLIGSDMVVADDLSETIECIMESLISYIFSQ